MSPGDLRSARGSVVGTSFDRLVKKRFNLLAFYVGDRLTDPRLWWDTEGEENHREATGDHHFN